MLLFSLFSHEENIVFRCNKGWKVQCCSVFEELWIQRKSILFKNAICRAIDGLRDCYIEWSKLNRERQLLYDTTYMWNLEKKWYKWTCLQNRNRVTNVGEKTKKNNFIFTKGERGRGINWEIGIDIYTVLYIE